MLDIFDELVRVVRRLDQERVPYALCGGLAVSVHAEPRATQDIDILLPHEQFEAAKRALHKAGFDLAAQPMSFAAGKVPIRRLSKLDPAGDTLSVDILLVTDATKDAWHDRTRVQWEAGELSIVSRRGLIALKRLRGSPQDMADIEKLERNGDE